MIYVNRDVLKERLMDECKYLARKLEELKAQKEGSVALIDAIERAHGNRRKARQRGHMCEFG